MSHDMQLDMQENLKRIFEANRRLPCTIWTFDRAALELDVQTEWKSTEV